MRSKWLGALALGLASITGLAQESLLISEFMASNDRTLADEDGEYPDWIEIHNAGSSSVNLLGWHLTDDATDPAKWRFPSVTLGPKDFLVVFASGKNRVGTPLHANFSLNAGGEYLALIRPDGRAVAWEFAPQFPEQVQDISYGLGQQVTETELVGPGAPVRVLVPAGGALGTTWTAPGFNDTTWTSGRTGVGYETAVPGFAVRNVKANVTVGSLSAAEGVLNNPSQQTRVVSENSNVVNYYGTGPDSHYGNSRPFPGAVPGADVDDFVIEATATITIPAAGAWTFGVNSDDGFRLDIGTFSISFPNPRSPGDTLGVFTVPAPGDYPLRLVFYERGGGSGVELFAAEGNFSAWDGGRFRLVGDTGNGGLAVRSAVVAGGGAAGYRSLIATDIQSLMQDINASAYARIPFTVANPAALESLALRIKYDDGFIAYLNEAEVARRNAPAGAQWNSAATVSRPVALGVEYEEINLTDRLGLLVAGSNLLAIHGLNDRASDTDFLVLPSLVERKVAGLSNHYFSVPTPGAVNSTGFFAFVADTKFSHDRGFYDGPFNLAISTATTNAIIRYTTNGTPPSLTNGLTYNGPIPIGGTTVLRAAAFRDGFEPSNVDTHSYIFVADVIRQSANGQAPPGWPSSWGGNVVDYGMDPDVVDHPAYRATIQDDLKSIPSFSIVMDVRDLFDPSRGIYANAGQDGRNWERPSSVELIFPDGTEGFQVNAGIRIRGGFSRSGNNPKHAFRLFFREEYGDTKLRYPLFGDRGADRFDGVDLRTFQNYSWSFQGDGRGIFLRDQFSRDAQLAMGQAGERGDFYHLYINGQYWGLFNTAERPEASYGETYFGGRKEDYDVIKVEAGPYTINATDGNMDAWTRLYNLGRAGFASDAAYYFVQGRNPDGSPNPAYETLLDVPNLIDYMLIILYGGNLDAPISNFLSNTRPNNFFAVRNRTGPDGFRFFAHDAEHTLLNVNENRTGPYPSGDTSVVYSNPQWIWQKLGANAEFRLRVADHVHRHFFNGGVLTPAGARALFLARKDETDRAVVGESARWGDAKRSTPFTRNTEWMAAINTVLNNYLPQRSGIVLNQLRADGLYPSVAAPAFTPHGGNVARGFGLEITAPAGTIYYTLDGTDPRLQGGAVSARARIYTGPVSINESGRVKSRVLNGSAWSALNEADFTVIQTFTELLITELMYHPPPLDNVDGDEFEFLELKNVASVELDLSGVHFTNGISFVFTNGARLAPGQFIVLAANPAEFARKHPGVRVDGAYTGRLANGGESVALVHAVGTPIFSVSYSDLSPWPLSPDGAGFSLVPTNPNLNPDPNDPNNWRASSRAGGSPGSDDPPVNLPAVWINEILTHTDPPLTDAVELHNPTAATADLSHWFLTDDRAAPKKFKIPPGTLIPAGGFLVFREADFNPNPGVDPSFSFSSHGESVYLYSADAAGNLTGYSDGFSFGAAANGVSFGRYTTSNNEIHYPAQQSNTLGAANAGPQVGPVVINEIRYLTTSSDDEFIELKNITGSAVKLFDPQFPANQWQINGIGFTFPPNAEIPTHGLLLLASGDPVAFRSRNSVPAGVPIYGPFPGSLQDNGESLELRRPDTPDVQTNGAAIVPYITVDAVRYSDRSPWPASVSGGAALERISAGAYGNDPINWRSSGVPPSPGIDNGGNRVPLVNAGVDLRLEVSALPFTTNLAGSATDDGLPRPPGQLAITWSQVSGPGVVAFANPSQLGTAVSLPGLGTYVLRLTANDGQLTAADEVTVVLERTPTQVSFVPAGALWRYLDNNSNQGTAWRAPAFNDSAWKSGRAQLGYGDGDEATVISFGPNANNKFRTTYFRHRFTVANAASVKELTARLLRDDGAVVYLNGEEIFRSNMPEGNVSFTTAASSAIGGGEESTFYERIADPSLLVEGSNVLAVEVHQANATSSDLSFDFELIGLALPSNTPPVVGAGLDLEVTLPAMATLEGAVTDDGLPVPPGLVAITWSKVSGPGTVTFQNPNAAVTGAAFSQAGTYVLRLIAHDGALSAQDEVSVIVRADDSLAVWKARYFTTPELNDPAVSGDGADPDGDSHTNLQEYIAGTDPRNPLSYLKIESIQRADGTSTVKIQFLAAASKSYSVLFRETVPAGNWTKLTDVSAQPSTHLVELIDESAAAQAQRYYRIATPGAP